MYAHSLLFLYFIVIVSSYSSLAARPCPQFTSLLWNVKAYNNRDQSRARTLENVFQSIGHKHPVIHEEFERLLSR